MMKGLECFGNPSSLHRAGLDAELLVSGAREIVAKSISAAADEIVFTSGATESSNTAIFGAFKSQGKRKHRVVTTTVEHPATARPVEELERLGCEVVRISPEPDGSFSEEKLISAVNEDTFLLTMMLVNNENGAVLPVRNVFAAVKRKFPSVLLHCDCVQGYMKLPLSVKELKADLISLSAHKITGPKGIGALYIRKGVHLPPLMLGGGQEKNMRSGTESVPLICGFGAAVEELAGSIAGRLEKARAVESYLLERCSENGGIKQNFTGEGSPYVTSLSVEGLRSEVLLHYLEKKGICVSSGSACSKGKKSSVLREFGVPDKDADSTIRVSIGINTTKEDIDRLMEALSDAQKELARVR